jgi:hypothetical protein
VAGVDDRERLDRLPGMCSKEPMRVPTISRIRAWLVAGMERLWSQLTPPRQAGEIAAIAVDAMRSRRELVLENAVLRHQVNVLRRRSKRPKLHLIDRLKLLVGARWSPSWRQAIALVQPETVLRWHRAGFRRFWRRRSRPRTRSPLPPETIDLIRDMAARGRLWGAERIRGELLKLGIKVSKRTIPRGRAVPRARGVSVAQFAELSPVRFGDHVRYRDALKKVFGHVLSYRVFLEPFGCSESFVVTSNRKGPFRHSPPEPVEDNSADARRSSTRRWPDDRWQGLAANHP